MRTVEISKFAHQQNQNILKNYLKQSLHKSYFAPIVLRSDIIVILKKLIFGLRNKTL